MNSKLTIVLALVLFFILFISTPLFAQNKTTPSPSPTPMVEVREIPYEAINPDSGSGYITKRFKEKIMLFFAFSDTSKYEMQKDLVEARLAELKYTIDNKQMGFFEKATQRYFTTAGQLTDFLVSKKMTEQAKETKELFESHLPILMQLRDTYNPTTAEWRFVEDDVNYIKADITKLSQ